MPALQIIGCGRGGPDGRRRSGWMRGLTTRPFAGDDLQLLCLLMGAYRVIQVACIVPFWIRVFLFRLHGRNFIGPAGHPSWCVDDIIEPSAAVYLSGDTVNVEGNYLGDWVDAPKDMFIPFTLYLLVSVIYTGLDIMLLMGIWSAASVGTPAEPRGRDKALRTLIWIKLVFMNCLLVVVLGSGIYFVAEGRRTNYGCGDVGENDAVSRVEESPWYAMFCVVLVTYAFELLLWPCMVMNQAGSDARLLYRNTFDKHGHRQATAACYLGGCVKCLQCCSCNRLGGGKIRAQSDLKDAAIALMDFFNGDDASFDIVLSDVWLAFKMLARVRRERIYKLSEQAKRDRRGKDEGAIVLFSEERKDADDACDNALDTGQGGIAMHRDESNFFAAEDKFLVQNAHPTSFADANVTDIEESKDDTARRTMLRHNRPSDMHHIRKLARYSHYALGPYDIYADALFAEGLLDGGRTGVYCPTLNLGRSDINGIDGTSLSSCYRLAEFGLPKTAVVYATFETDIILTPYCILVDEDERTIVVTIRGSATLEDMVTDMQFTSSEMSKVGKICGFDGSGKWVHRGMLAKCKWIYNDLTRRKILSRLLPTDASSATDNPYSSFNLVFTGHSLGAGIAAILGIMFKPSYPTLKCYSYCPPGCSVSRNLAVECEDYVVSIVVGNDVIPRIRGSNFEMLRFEFLEILARIKVPKIQAWRELRTPCNSRDLEHRNKRLLYSKDDIPSSAYRTALNSFREKRKRLFDEISPAETRLNIPGRIVHLVHAMDRKGDESDKYLPYWESLMALREIHMSVEVMKQHSMDNLVIHLEKILADYENRLQGTSEDDDSSVESQQDPTSFDDRYETSFSADDRWFILCSQPLGSVTLIPTMLSIASLCCSALGNNICSLFFREVIDGELYLDSPLTNGTVSDVTGFNLGLYSYGVEYLLNDDYILQCTPALPEGLENDAYIRTARAFAALSVIVGIPVVCFLGLSNCMMFTRRMFRRNTVALLFVAFCQGMVFVYLRSDPCQKQDYFLYLTGVELLPCRLDDGSKLTIAASVMWFAAAIFSACIDRASIVEGHLRLLAMHASRRITD